MFPECPATSSSSSFSLLLTSCSLWCQLVTSFSTFTVAGVTLRCWVSLPLSSFPDAGLPTLIVVKRTPPYLSPQTLPSPSPPCCKWPVLVWHSNSQSPCRVRHLHLLHTKHSYLGCCQIPQILNCNLSKISCHAFLLTHLSVSELAYLNLYKLYQLSQYYARSIQNPVCKILCFCNLVVSLCFSTLLHLPLPPSATLKIFTFSLLTPASPEDCQGWAIQLTPCNSRSRKRSDTKVIGDMWKHRERCSPRCCCAPPFPGLIPILKTQIF